MVRPESAPRLLTDLDEKLELLASTGVDYTLVVHFDKERSEELAEDFVNEVLVNQLNVKAVIVGQDFHFGHKRQGDVPLLQRMGAELGFDVIGIGLIDTDGSGTPVSSTRIRQLLGEGAVEEAAEPARPRSPGAGHSSITEIIGAASSATRRPMSTVPAEIAVAG